MSAERDVAVMIVDSEEINIRERIVLRVKFSAADLLDKLLDVGRNWLKTQRAKHLPVQFAHLRADADAAAIGGRADRAPAGREGAEAVVPEAPHANRQRVAHAALEMIAQLCIERAVDGVAVTDDERQLKQLEFGNGLSETHG